MACAGKKGKMAGKGKAAGKMPMLKDVAKKKMMKPKGK